MAFVSVTYPAMRMSVINALAALADPEYQERVWIRRVFPQSDYVSDLSMQIHALYDDNAVLPDPRSALGAVLLTGDEIPRLEELDRRLGPMLDELGNRPDSDYLQDVRWPGVVAAATCALTAMVLAGGIPV